MPGSMRERQAGVWELRVFLGRDAAGKTRHRSVTFRGGKRAAGRELSRLVIGGGERASSSSPSSDRRTPRWGGQTTINEAIAGWKENGWEDLSPSTVRRYENMWMKHVYGSIGMERLATLSPFDVEKYFRRLKADGLAEATVRQIRALMHRACRLARKWSGGVRPIRSPTPSCRPGLSMSRVKFGRHREGSAFLDYCRPRCRRGFRRCAASGRRHRNAAW